MLNTEYFICSLPEEPYLLGEDYPALFQVWDNEEDNIYDTLIE